MHATNTIAGIVYEIHNGKGPISLQRITTVPLEKLFGVTRLHARTHQTMANVVRQMEIDQAMRLVYAHHEVQNRRLAYGETVAPSRGRHALQFEPNLLADALLKVVGFPSALDFSLAHVDDPFSYVEYLMSDVLRPFVKANLSARSVKKTRSLCQQLQGIGPSRSRLLLTSKSDMRRAMGVRPGDPIERQLLDIFGGKRLLSADLKVLVHRVSREGYARFEGRRSLGMSTKAEVLDWVSEHWSDRSGPLRMIAANTTEDAGGR
jgi:hypothetical protein